MFRTKQLIKIIVYRKMATREHMLINDKNYQSYICSLHKFKNNSCKIITLCGSTKFKDTFMHVNEQLTLYNKIVLMPGVYCHSDNIHITTTQKQNLDILHKEKIDLSDAILVINQNNYIGESTKSEIEYAKYKNKEIYYYIN